MHKGVDFAAPKGTPTAAGDGIMTMQDGTVLMENILELT